MNRSHFAVHEFSAHRVTTRMRLRDPSNVVKRSYVPVVSFIMTYNVVKNSSERYRVTSPVILCSMLHKIFPILLIIHEENTEEINV